MKNQNYRVSRATLYNTIELLLACNLVRKHQFGKNIAQFEKSHGSKQHDHMICTDTGEVIEFCDPRIQNIKATIEELFGVTIHHHSLYFYGVYFDLITLALLGLPMFLFYNPLISKFKRTWHGFFLWLAKLYLILLSLFVLVLNSWDIAYYSYTQKRSSFSYFDAYAHWN